jgi:uncharacterized membrane protein
MIRFFSLLRVVLGLFILLFLPGFTLSLLFFPNWKTLEGYERIAISVGLSIALLILMGYALNITPWGMQVESILASLGTVIIGGLIYYRVQYTNGRHELLAEIRHRISRQYIIALSIVVSIVFGLSWLAMTPPGVAPTTEFFVVEHKVQNDRLFLTLGIINDDTYQSEYTLLIQADGIRIGSYNLVLEPFEQWKNTLSLHLPEGKLENPLRIESSLLRNEKVKYRSLHFWVKNNTHAINDDPN